VLTSSACFDLLRGGVDADDDNLAVLDDHVAL
jgi:hypothetical protein